MLRLIVVAGFLLGAPPSETRQWTDETGRYAIRADLVEVRGDQVRLKTAEGKIVSIPLARLSETDRRWLAANGKTPAEGKGVPKGQDMPPSVVKYLQAVETTVEREIERLQDRAQKLQMVLARSQDPALSREFAETAARLKVLRARGKPVLPRLSPKDLSEGLIGIFDESLLFSMVFLEGPKQMVLRVGTTAGEEFRVRGIATTGIKTNEFLGDRYSTVNLALHGPVFEILRQERCEKLGRPIFVVQPFDMTEVNRWLREHEKPVK